MKKILLILVGGTICTALNEKGTLSIDKNSGVLIRDNFLKSDSAYTSEVEFTLTENLEILSENMTVDKWNLLLDTYKKYVAKDSFDGVIFAHGTDTLAYTASLFSMLLSGCKIPHFFVSANARLTSEKSNGNDNFKAAVECICKGITPNVYVTYKNISDNKMYLHLASRIRQCENYSEDFYSNGMLELSEADLKSLPENKTNRVLPDQELKDCVLKIDPYVGINYKAFDYSKFKAILHGTYHSGTAWTDGISCLLKNCGDADVYFSPSSLEGEIYETVSEIADHDISFLYGMTEETAYAKLLIAYSIFDDENERKEFVKKEMNFEYFY